MASKTENEASGTINIIGNGTSIHGDVASHGDFRLDGAIQGQFVSKLKLVIGPTGYIEGDIECKDCEIFGKVKGNILVHETLVLRETAEVCGDIRINRLSIEPGAVFTGHCSMLNVAVPVEVAE
ncbi:MAG: polymer-forming cytoskeletal protein [Bacteroidales bacterium]|nr:polymer-forming cytoskeletal protein [Bacteroidales bacterium]